MLNNLFKRLHNPSSALENTIVIHNQNTLDELLKTKARLRAINDSSFDALTMLGDDGFIDCNTAALALFGCANLDEFCRYHTSDLSPKLQACGTDSKTLNQYYIDLTLKNGSCRFEWLHQRADNGIIFETEVQLFSMEIDGATFIQGVRHDLTAIKNTAARLANKKKKVKKLKLAMHQHPLLLGNPYRVNKIFQNIPGMVYEFSLTAEGHTSFPYVSEGIQDIYELNPEQVKADAAAIFARIHPDDLAKVTASIQESARSMQPWHMEYRVLLPKKGLRWLLATSNPEQQANGSVVWYGFNSDITAQKLLETTLTQVNILQEATFNSAIFSSITTDAQGMIQIFNVGAENMLGYSATEIVNKMSPADFSDTQELIIRANALSIEYGITITPGFESLAYKASQEIQDVYELNYIHKDGHRIAALVSITALRDATETIIGYLLIATDHTKKKAAQQQLKTLSLALEQSQSAVMITDLNINIEYINQAFINSSGYAREDIIGQSLSRFMSGKTPQSTYETMRAALNSGKAWRGELINLNKQDEEFIELTWISPIRQDDGTISHYLSVKEDITERKKTERLLVEAKDRAEHLAKTKAQFLANMSHEIRTPMIAIMGFSDLALLDEIPPDTYDYLQNISIASNHLLAILNSILDASKLDAGKMTLQLEHFNLADMRAMLHGLFINTAQSKGLTLIIDIASQVPDILIGDSLRLRQVLINLLGNAIKFTQQGSIKLRVSLQQLDAKEARLLFAVTDTGMGISAEQQERLFQPFSQVNDGNARNFEGTGLGLMISQNLVQLMGASIKLDSHVGLGSCFSFELLLPLALATIEPQITPSITLSPTSLSGVQILLVEDNDFNQKIITQVLKSFGASIVLADNGLEALAALEQDNFDIVLMDLQMPIMDGYQATSEIRKQARYAQLPIITISATVSEEDNRRCLAAGMIDFIGKPINKIELLATLERWLKR